jgi:hypothetical protein
MAVVVLAAMLIGAAVPALAADQAADTKALTEQVRSLQDANVVMKEDLAKTQLQLAEMAAKNRADADAARRELADLAKQMADLRQSLADERAAHEAELKKAQDEAARQRSEARRNRMWLYIVGGAALIYAASQ